MAKGEEEENIVVEGRGDYVELEGMHIFTHFKIQKEIIGLLTQ